MATRTSRIPTWVKIGIPLLILLVLAVAVAVQVLLDELPPAAQPDALQVRFAQQLSFLEDLAVSYPSEACEVLASEDPTRLVEMEVDAAWQERLAEGRALFSAPGILGAYVSVCHEDDRRVFAVAGSTIATLRLPQVPLDVDKPTVNREYTGDLQLVRYENLVLDRSGERRGYELLLDLEPLED